MAKKLAEKEVDINTKLVEELLSKADSSELFGRSLKELLETVETLKKAKINFMSLEEQIDTSSAVGELVFHVFASIAHFERRLIAERTKDGLGHPPLDCEKLDSAFKLIKAGTSPINAAKSLDWDVQLCTGR